MTLKELNIFYKLSDNTHISSLAKELNLTQSALSLSIKSLEKKLDTKLFDRIGKKLLLNDRGREFKEKTYEHFLNLKDAEELFVKDKISGQLNIALSKTIGEFIMPQIIYNFLVKFPHVKINRDIQNSANIIKLIKNGSIDMGFIESDYIEPQIVKETIGEDNPVIVTSNKKLKNREFYIDELFEKKWILREKGSGTREIFLNALGNFSKDIKIFMEFSEFEEAKTLLCNNANVITCISKRAVEKELQRGELFELKLKNIEIKRDFYLIYHKNKHQSRLFREFKDFIKP
ncbi:MAG: LysR family transcriptional regulator [Sulfurospirillum sp.]